MPARRPVAALALVAALWAGCGEAAPSPEAQVRDTVSAFGRAIAAKDYARLCDDVLAPALLVEVEAIGLPCEKALETALADLRDPRLTVGEVLVTGERASAEVRTSAAGQEPSSDVLQLEKVAGAWRVASLGGTAG